MFECVTSSIRVMVASSWADTTSATGKLVMTFLTGLAEFEKDLFRDRTNIGRRAALERGVRFGRPIKMTEEQLKLARKLLKQGKSVLQDADIFGVHFTGLYRYLRGAKSDLSCKVTPGVSCTI